MESKKFTPKILRKDWEVRQCVASFDFLEKALSRVLQDAMGVKPALQWIQDAGCAKSILRKPAGNGCI